MLGRNRALILHMKMTSLCIESVNLNGNLVSELGSVSLVFRLRFTGCFIVPKNRRLCHASVHVLPEN